MSMKKEHKQSEKPARNEKCQPVKPGKKHTTPTHPAKPTKNNKPFGDTVLRKNWNEGENV